ncbi:hypothetical protein P7C70_g6277, partial [Phenoliferia sp. Uapishka_3]
MLKQSIILSISLLSIVSAFDASNPRFHKFARRNNMRREVPQEHSHEQFLTTVRTSLNVNNPGGVKDVVFGLLGNAAAITGANGIDPDCLQQATADQAFTNAKAASDVAGMTAALVYAALERNTGSVGLASVLCTAVKATNPEIAAISRHQDPASSGAAAINKASTLGLAVQIAAIGGDPQTALKAGTFAPNLIVEDATAAEITAAVASGGTGVAASNSTVAASPASGCAADASANSTVVTAPASASVVARAGGNLQTFTGTLGGAPPEVTAGGRGFIVSGIDDFVGEAAALKRSCDIQHNACANAANSGGGFSLEKDTACTAAISA